MSQRCPVAIDYGTNLATRCFLDADHLGHRHRGRGLRDGGPPVVEWVDGDAQAYLTTREDHWSWTR